MDNVLEKIKAKSFYHNFFEDGCWDLVIGLVYLGTALFLYFEQYLQKSYLSAIVLLGMMYGVPKIPQFYRKLITYPRIGIGNYDRLTRTGPLQNMRIFSIFVLIFILGLLNLHSLTDSHLQAVHVSAIFGIVTGLIMIAGGWRNSVNLLIAGLLIGTLVLFVQFYFMEKAYLVMAAVVVLVVSLVGIAHDYLMRESKKEVLIVFDGSKIKYLFIVLGLVIVIMNSIYFFAPYYLNKIVDYVKNILYFNEQTVFYFSTMSIMLILYGIFYKVKRLVGYGLLLILIHGVSLFLSIGLNPLWDFTIAGLIILMNTLYIGKRFVNKYPVLEDVVMAGNETGNS